MRRGLQALPAHHLALWVDAGWASTGQGIQIGLGEEVIRAYPPVAEIAAEGHEQQDEQGEADKVGHGLEGHAEPPKG